MHNKGRSGFDTRSTISQVDIEARLLRALSENPLVLTLLGALCEGFTAETSRLRAAPDAARTSKQAETEPVKRGHGEPSALGCLPHRRRTRRSPATPTGRSSNAS
ncbi:hypothetical protein Rumeso_03318 [Rubellimicrobium mesophilum DSM 19309]|uniref:Uncharacterized protein n=1 Tax=Rubellimicrobium mesophilum DSM 19309 TaxID=442562 RepID=A0A017HLC3_9RHOB|nr:hypothetical protein Rumeso_03318 [Rubellimicrobium mesophilum DSM 19309]